jgi:hypothetical protein
LNSFWQKKPKYIDSSHNRSNRYLQEEEMNNIITKIKEIWKSTHKKQIPPMSIYTIETNYPNLYNILLSLNGNNQTNRERERGV